MPDTYTKDGIAEIMQKFHDVILYIQSDTQVWSDTVHECDEAFGDMYHYCELSDTEDKEKQVNIFATMKKYGIRRRHYKELLAVTKPIADWAKNTNTNGLFKACNDVVKQNAKSNGDKLYRARQLSSLFSDGKPI